MRTKEEILESSHRALLKIPGDAQVMVEHEHLFLEVWTDIRDILDKELKRTDTAESRFIKTPQKPLKP